MALGAADELKLGLQHLLCGSIPILIWSSFQQWLSAKINGENFLATPLVAGFPFIDNCIRFLFIACFRLGLFIYCRSVGIVVEDHEHWEVIGSYVGQPAQFHEQEMLGCEDVIQGIAQESISGIKGVDESATDPRVEQSADSLK